MKMFKGINKLFLPLVLLMMASNSAFALESVVYFHNDLLGSPVAATNGDGEKIWEQSYQPYGKHEASENPDAWFTSKPLDEKTGLTYMNARYYDPDIGRFLSVDPETFLSKGGDVFNRYRYANNNPYLYIDPDGKNGVTAFGGLLNESYRWASGDGFDGQMLYGALRDGYDGNGAGFWNAAGEDALSFGGGLLGAGAKAYRVFKGAKNSRQWYHKQLDSISSQINSSLPIREQALQAFKLRNEIKLQARSFNPKLSMFLPAPRTLDDVVRRAYMQGARGDDVWRYVLSGSQRSSRGVDDALGLSR